MPEWQAPIEDAVSRIPYPDIANLPEKLQRMIAGTPLNVVRMGAHASPPLFEAQGALGYAIARPDVLEPKLRVEGDFVSGFTREGFIEAVEKSKEYIRSGDVFQVVLSQRMSVPFRARPVDVYRALRSLNPSPYMYFLDLGATQIVGSSPEILVRLKQGRVVLRPIAGSDDEMIERARAVGDVLPVVGFYLQPAVGGRVLSRDFWRRFAALDCVAGIKIAPFDRYRTLDVLNGVAGSGRHDKVALYTGNDNNILGDLITPYDLQANDGRVTLRFVGGLLGQFAVWTRVATALLADAKRGIAGDAAALQRVLRADGPLTDANAALFDVANAFRGSIAGINEILARQGLLAGRWCLDPDEDLSPGQAVEIERVLRAYPQLTDDGFIAEHRDEWLK